MGVMKNITEGEISIPVWYKSGGTIYNRDCLPASHPENTYNYIKRVCNVDPELYGVKKPEIKTVPCAVCGAPRPFEEDVF
jgi:hypothetical protein